jgi:hypothetical protein
MLRIHCAALNRRIVGSDFADVVVQAGGDILTEANFRVGDGVAGFLQGACSVNGWPGAFAELVIISWNLVWKMPKPSIVKQLLKLQCVSFKILFFRMETYGCAEVVVSSRRRRVIAVPWPLWSRLRACKPCSPHGCPSESVAGWVRSTICIRSPARSPRAPRMEVNTLPNISIRCNQLVDYRDPEWPE